MRFLILISFVFLTIRVNAQAIINQSYQYNRSENAIGFAGYNTFNACLSQCSGSGIRLLGVNNDETIRFNTWLGGNGMFDMSKMFGIVTKKKTKDKGLIFVLYGMHTATGSGCKTYNVSCYARIDSIGNTVFSKYFNGIDYYGGIDSISNNFYFITDQSLVSRIHPLTGVITNSIYNTSSSNTITASSVTSKKQIAISTTYSVLIVDTLGNLIYSKPASFIAKRIVSSNKDFLFINKNGNLLEKRDSALQIIATYTIDANYTINDLDFYNDTLYLALFNNATKLSKIICLDYNLNNIQSKNIENTYQELKGIQKDDKLKIILNENAEVIDFPSPAFRYYATTGFAVFNSIDEIQFDHDLVITNITNLTCTTSSASGQSYNYQNKITIYNNSPLTVNTFNLNHYNIPYYFPGSSTSCTGNQYVTMYAKNYSVTINPYQSIDVILPQFAYNVYPSYTPSGAIVDLNFNYNVNSPNGKTEANTANSTYSQTIHFDFSPPPRVDLSNLLLYPNPTEKFINFNSIVGLTKYIIHDVLGNKIMESTDFSNVDVSALSQGLYFITVEDAGNQKVIKKFLKSKS